MTPTVGAVLAASAVLALFGAHRPVAGRGRAGAPAPHGAPGVLNPLLEAVGRWVLRVTRSGAAGDAGAARWAGRATASAVLLLPTAGALAAAAAVVVCAAAPRAARRRTAARRAEALVSALPETIDLLTVAVGAGLTVRLAVAAVSRRGEGPVAAALGAALAEADSGRRLADALDDLPGRCGAAMRPLTAALVASERYGAPLGPTLERIAADVRLAERRRAEEVARRIPVRLLFPLVVCILPAFALLTVAPLLASGLQSLRL